MNNLLLFLLITLSFNGLPQDHKTAIAGLNNLEDAQVYADKHQDVNVIFLHENLENSTYLQMKDTLKVGDSFKMQFYRLRVVELGKKDLYNCRYIFMNDYDMIDGEAQINQDKIIEELKAGKNFSDLHSEYSMDDNENGGDLGWIDPDHMAAGFRDALLEHKNGDFFKCSDDSLGWHYVVEITEKPKKVEGHYMLIYPEEGPIEIDQNIDHEANLKELSTDEEVRDYARKNEAVNLHLLNEINDLKFFSYVNDLVKKGEPVVGNKVDIEGMRYVVLKDTTVKLYTFQYIFIDGSTISDEERKRRVNDIYTRYNEGESFQSLVNAYWTENKEYSTMSNVDGSLLMEELVAQLNAKGPGELFVARTSQSYFVGIPIEATKLAKAYLAISYPLLVE